MSQFLVNRPVRETVSRRMDKLKGLIKLMQITRQRRMNIYLSLLLSSWFAVDLYYITPRYYLEGTHL